MAVGTLPLACLARLFTCCGFKTQWTPTEWNDSFHPVCTLLSVHDCLLGQLGPGSQRRLFFSTLPYPKTLPMPLIPFPSALASHSAWLDNTNSFPDSILLHHWICFLPIMKCFEQCSRQYKFLPTLLSTFLICLEFWLCSWVLHCPAKEYCLRKHRLCPSQLQVGIPVLLLVILWGSE